MATKIQLRRDVSTSWVNSNPILAQGEPGMEIDTRKFKLGDGVTPWNGLGYSDKNNMQDFFILLQQGTNSWYPTVNSVSLDGDNWTASKTLGSGSTGGEDPQAGGSGYQQFATYNVAAGNGKVVYTVYFSNNSYYFGDNWYSGLAVADNPFEAPRLIQQPGTFSTPDEQEQEIEWDNIQFEGGYFVATGNYYYNQSPWYYAPCFAYSQDGENWTWGKVDQEFIQSVPGLDYNGYNDTCGMLFTGVSYNGSGWLFTNEWYTCGSSTTPYNAGAFYVTNLSAELNESNFVANAPTHDVPRGYGDSPMGRIIWAGSRWVGTDFRNNIYYNNSTNPLQGSWVEYDISAAQIQAFGNDVSNIMQIDSVNLGGTQYTVILLEDSLVMSSTDGINWTGRCALPVTDRIFTITSGSNTVINFDSIDSNWSGFPGTIAVDIAGLPDNTFPDGRYFVNPDTGELYSTPNTPSPVTSGDSFSTIDVSGTMIWGDSIIHINNVGSHGLKVGMALTGYSWYGGPYTGNGNKIKKIDVPNNLVVMERPLGDTGTYTLHFGPSVVMAYGYGSATMTHGNGKLIVMNDSFMFGMVPSTTTDLVNWNSTIGLIAGNESNWHSYNSWFDHFDYYGFTFGTTTSYDNSMISNNQAWLPGLSGLTGDYRISGIANSATLGSNFQVDITGITANDGFIHQQLYMNPEQGWFLGQDSNVFFGGGEAMTGVGSTSYGDHDGYYDVFIQTGNGNSGSGNQAQWTFANPYGPNPAMLWLPTDSADIVNDSGYSITLNGLYVEVNAPNGNGNLEYSPPDDGDTGYLTFTPAAVSGLYPVPATSRGSEGDVAGMLAADSGWLYYCSANWDGTTHIWKREPWSNETW